MFIVEKQLPYIYINGMYQPDLRRKQQFYETRISYEFVLNVFCMEMYDF